MKPLIVVPTHRSGTAFLVNLLESFKNHSPYPILIVVNDHRSDDEDIYAVIAKRYSSLSLSVEYLASNSFELGGLLVAMERTDCDEFFLVSHSCEIVDHGIFELVFETHGGVSIGLASQTGNWAWNLGKQREYESLILTYLEPSIHERLLQLGEISFWQGHLGKYRRPVLELLDLYRYLPNNMIEAISKSELLFSHDYQQLEPESVILFPRWYAGVIEEKFGKPRMKIANEYIIKWKSHWTAEMVYSDMMGPQFMSLSSRLRRRIRAVLRVLGIR